MQTLSRPKQLSFAILLLAIFSSAAFGQTDQRLAFVMIPGGTNLRVKGDVEPGSGTTGNGTKLTNALANATLQSPYILDAVGNSDIRGRYQIDDAPVRTPKRSGLVIVGGGLGRVENEGANTAGYAPRIIQTTTAYDFNGTTVTATTSGASDKLIISGFTVSASHVGYTLRPDSGANFITNTGYYVVTAVGENVGGNTNTWTLDRVCSNGNGSALVGRATETLWEEHGSGTTYAGLQFRGNVKPNPGLGDPNPPLKTNLLFHVVRNDGLSGSVENGKHTWTGCVFSDAAIGRLYGRDARQAFGQAATFTGDEDLHADHGLSIKCWNRNLTAAHLFRCTQSVNHRSIDERFSQCTDCFYVERGGELMIFGAGVSGNSRLLRFGRINGNGGSFTIQGGGFDGATTSPQIVGMDREPDDSIQISINGFQIDKGVTNFTRALLDLKGATRCTVTGGNRYKPNSIKLTQSSGGQRPVVILMGAHLEPTDGNGSLTAGTHNLIVDPTSTAGCFVYFYGCTNWAGTITYDGKLLTGGGFVQDNPAQLRRAKMLAAAGGLGAEAEAVRYLEFIQPLVGQALANGVDYNRNPILGFNGIKNDADLFIAALP